MCYSAKSNLPRDRIAGKGHVCCVSILAFLFSQPAQGQVHRAQTHLTNATSASARSAEHKAQGIPEWHRDGRGEAWEGLVFLG